MSIRLFSDIIVIVLSLLSVVVLIMVIFRTSKGLDRAFKMYACTAASILVASVLVLDRYFGFFSLRVQETIFIGSRVLALLFFLAGNVIILNIVTKESEKQ